LKATDGLPRVEKAFAQAEAAVGVVAADGSALAQLGELISGAEVAAQRVASIPGDTLADCERRLSEIVPPDDGGIVALVEIGRNMQALTESVARDKAAEERLSAELAAYNVCPECGASKEHWRG
jgi:ABC-type transporter Mla MlaB component